MAETKTTGRTRCCTRVKNFFSLSPEGATPFDWPVLSIVVCALFGSAYSITFLFPFLPDMVLYMGYAEEEKGYYSGYIASSMFAGRIFGSFFWGWVSDRYGRRPVMLFTTLAVGVCNLAFGFSRSLIMAMATRFANGLFNGLVGTCKTVLYEISDDTNQAVGMSAIAMAWGSGVVLGPLISGYLAEPAKKYPHAFPEGSLFHTFPFLLPGIVACGMSVIGFIAVFFKLPETLNKRTSEVVVDESDLKDEEETPEAAAEAESLMARIDSQSAVPKSKSTSHIDHAFSKDSQKNTPDLLRRTNTLTKRPRGHVQAQRHLSKSVGHLHPSAKFQDAYDVYGLGQPLNLSQQILSESSHQIPSKSQQIPSPLSQQIPSPLSQQLPRKSFQAEKSSSVTSLPNGLDSPKSLKGFPEANGHVKIEHSFPETNRNLPESNGHTQSTNGNLSPESNGHAKSANGNLSPGAESVTVDTKVVQSRTGVPVIKVETPSEDRAALEEKKTTVKCCSKLRKLTPFRLLGQRDVVFSIVLYTLFSFAVVGWEEIFIVWASTEVRLAGLALSAEKIGAAVGGASSGLLFIQVFLYPKLVGRFGTVKVMQVAVVYLVVVSGIIPSLRYLLHEPIAMWVLLVSLTGVQKLAVTSAFSSISLFLNNSVQPGDAGSVNGIGMTFSALARTLAPSLVGSMFAWSITEGARIGFPLDVNFAFVALSLVFLSVNIVSAFMPHTLQKQKKPDQTSQEESQV